MTRTTLFLFALSVFSQGVKINPVTGLIDLVGGTGGGGSGTVTSVDATGGLQTASGSAITSSGTIRAASVANAQTGTTYTFLTGDRGKLVTFSNASAIAATLPQAGTGFEDGWCVVAKSIGPGDTTITPTTSTISGTTSITLSLGESARICSNGTNYEATTDRVNVDSALSKVSSRSGGVTIGVGATVATLSGTQSLTNKTMDNTNIFTIRDDRLTLQDSGDVTKQAQLQLSGITAGQTRVYTLPDLSATLATTSTNSWTDGVTQTFNPDATLAGINVGSVAGDPSGPNNGDLWYDSTANELTARINGANVALGAGGGTGCNPGGSATNVLTDNGSGACTSNAAFKYTSGVATLGTAGSVVGSVALLNATSGSITISPPTGALGTVTVTVPAATDTLVGKATTDALTNKTVDAEATGNVITLPFFMSFLAANCQGTTAFTAFATPTANAPAAECVTGTNTNYGVLSFDAGTDESVQMHMPLPSDWTGNIDLDLNWRAAATSGDVVWAVQTACVADGETGDPSFNTASTVTDTAKGTTLQFNLASMTSITVTGCAAGEELMFKIFRDADAGGDTMTGDAQLIWARFKIRRAI